MDGLERIIFVCMSLWYNMVVNVNEYKFEGSNYVGFKISGENAI